MINGFTFATFLVGATLLSIVIGGCGSTLRVVVEPHNPGPPTSTAVDPYGSETQAKIDRLKQDIDYRTDYIARLRAVDPTDPRIAPLESVLEEKRTEKTNLEAGL